MPRSQRLPHPLAAICIALLLLLTAAGPLPATAANSTHSLVNHPAPVFTLKDFQGRAIRLSQYRGKIVLLNFWASWCAPCQAEMPEFARWQTRFGGKLQVLGISMDDNLAQARAAAQRLKVNYPLLAGDQSVGQAYGGIFGLPETFLIDRQGKVRTEFQGGAHLNEIRTAIENMLKPTG